MLQLIGLIVAVYAMVRLLQVPFEHAAYEHHWLGTTFGVRAFAVCLLSGIGVFLIFSLTVDLLMTSITR